MMIISFAHTTEALLEGKKTVTRREWSDNHVRRFKAGQYAKGYDRSPRVGGKYVALIRLTCDPYKERLSDITEAEEIAEGSLWGSAQEFVRAYGGDPDRQVWVIRFQVVESSRKGLRRF